MTEKPLKLLIPGPVEVSQRVLDALGAPIQPHYGARWTKFYKDTVELLRGIFQTSGSIFIMAGSGTAAIDACLGSTFLTGEKIIIGNNGFFGERLKSVAESYGLRTVVVNAKWGEPLLADGFETAFRENPDAVGAAVVHLETSTTIQNPIEKIGPVVRKHGGVFMVDAVSSLGGVEIKMDEWCIDLCASATQKCLGAPPGLAPVAVGKRAWDFIDRSSKKAHGWYCNLQTWRQYGEEWGDWHPTPITMPVNLVAALRVGLEGLIQEGMDVRLENYRKLALRLRNGLRRLGYKLFTPDELMSPVLTAAYCPEGIESSRIVDYMAENYSIKISTGLGDLKEKIFRVGTMSPVLTEKDIDEFLDALANFHIS